MCVRPWKPFLIHACEYIRMISFCSSYIIHFDRHSRVLTHINVTFFSLEFEIDVFCTELSIIKEVQAFMISTRFSVQIDHENLWVLWRKIFVLWAMLHFQTNFNWLSVETRKFVMTMAAILNFPARWPFLWCRTTHKGTNGSFHENV